MTGFLAVLLIACATRGSAAPPHDSSFATLVLHRSTTAAAPDTLVSTFPCSGTGFTQCGIHAAAGSLTVLAPPVSIGAVGAIKILCSIPGPVTLTASLYGLSPGMNNSADTPTVSVTGDPCPVHTAGIPNSPVFSPLRAVSGGG